MRLFLAGDERGSVAVMALWALVILVFLSISLSQSVRQSMMTARHLHAREELRLAGEAAVKMTISDIQSSSQTIGNTVSGNEWYFGILGHTLSFSLGDATASFILEDENSKINLNTANTYLLTNLFQNVGGVGSEEAARLADAVVDFRDTDDHVSGEGANGGSERGVYRQAGLTLPPKNSNFEFIQELRLVKGVTKEIYSFVENYITIYGDGRVNINTASKEKLCSFGIVASLADKLIEIRSGAGLKGPEAEPSVFTDVSKIAETVSKRYLLSPVEEESLNHALTQGEFCVSSGIFKITGRTKVSNTNFSGRFECVYATGVGIRYWVQT